MSRIPQNFLDELLSRTDIVELIDQRVPLKKAGANHKACCPFHHEKTPSFTVSSGKQFYHCFGCAANGNAIGFLMAYDHFTFPEAVEHLAQQAGLTIPREASQYDAKTYAEQQAIHPILEAASHFYQQQLRQHPQHELAVNYLKQRGLSGEIAKRYALGFAPPGWDNLSEHLAQYTSEQLIKSGLRISNENKKSYDRFRGRVMFPIRNKKSETIGFGGRVLSSDEEPKYLNSSESPVFQKGRELYGLYEVLQAHHHHLEQIIVVEGYMDVLALAQHGIDCAVATLGTATTSDHIRLLQRHGSSIVFCFDGDKAGKNAAWKALTLCLPLLRANFTVKFIFLPQGEDPDTFIQKHGKSGFSNEIETALSLSDFFFAHLSENKDLAGLEQQAQLLGTALPLIRTITDPIIQELMQQALAKHSNTSVERLDNDHRSISAHARPRTKPNALRTPTKMQQIISLLLQNPSLIDCFDAGYPWSKLTLPGAKLLNDLITLLREYPNLSTGSILERWRDQPEAPQLAKLAARRSLLENSNAEETCLNLIAKLKENDTQQTIQKLQAKLAKNTISAEEHALLVQLTHSRSG